MEGILLVNKPTKMTSHDLVIKIRKIINIDKSQPKIKVGHTGTLDMAANGLMMLTIGRATKSTIFFQGLDKVYTTKAYLGISTDTYDKNGKITAQKEFNLSENDIYEALSPFRGTYMQLPPPYSAKKIGGRKAYKMAMKGLDVPLKPKEITIENLEVVSIVFPYVELKIHCTSGTYIRRIVHDLGNSLGCGAHVSSLCRHKIGSFSILEAYELSFLQEQTASQIESYLISLPEALEKIKVPLSK